MSEQGFIGGVIEGTTYAVGAAMIAGLASPDVLVTLAVALAASIAGAGRVIEHLPRALEAVSAFIARHR